MFTLNCRGRLLKIETPIVMGVINCSPDSFYSNSHSSGRDQILNSSARMIECGAAIIDIGGQSTRPGGREISEEEEMGRVVPAIKVIVDKFPDTPISVDTYYASVAKSAIEAGASIVNDISGGRFDDALLPSIAGLNVPYVLMHSIGRRDELHLKTSYSNLITEVLDFFIYETERLRIMGINDIIIDPGFGFSKNAAQNFELLKNLSAFTILNRPVLAGLSRKSTICRTLNISPEEALNGTTVLNTVALLNGASILRVHDPLEALQAIRLLNEAQLLPKKS